MTLPTTGPISAMQVRAELGVAGAISLGQLDVRTLAGVPSGPISFADLRGKTGPQPPSNLAATAVSDTATGTAPGSTFTATARPKALISGGTAPYITTVSIATQDDTGFVLSNADTSTPTVTHSIGKYGYIGQCTLNFVISDNAGASVELKGVVAGFNFKQPGTQES